MKAMAQAIKEQTGTGVRQGTATRRAGKETAARLVAAAHDQLEAETLERFSMRNVAERAGVSLANLQYYFPRREDLLRALYQDLGTRYRAAYEEVLAQAPDDPVERFQAVLEYNMKDISKRGARIQHEGHQQTLNTAIFYSAVGVIGFHRQFRRPLYR
jgi:AcrR family transcriptional regulator